MQREQVQALALKAGFTMKKQPSGVMDLNPYVYDFVELLFDESEELVLLRRHYDSTQRVVACIIDNNKEMAMEHSKAGSACIDEIINFYDRAEDY